MAVPRLLALLDYPTALRTFEWQALWELVDGTRERLNLAHECIDRHPPDAIALRIQHADGRRETHTFGALAASSSRIAHWLEREGIARGALVQRAVQHEAPDRVVLLPGPPTAEVLTGQAWARLETQLPVGITLERVAIRETPACGSAIPRPRKKMVALTLSPSSRKRSMCFFLNW